MVLVRLSTGVFKASQTLRRAPQCFKHMLAWIPLYHFSGACWSMSGRTLMVIAYPAISPQVDTRELEELGLKRHPDEVAEAASLASVAAPEVHVRLKLPGHVLESKPLAAAQQHEHLW
jgi:hypothetical protein